MSCPYITFLHTSIAETVFDVIIWHVALLIACDS